MLYAIRHFTRYRYSPFVWQSMMEVRMHPRSEGNQRCFVFQLSVNPRARIFGYTDSYGNLVHHFDLPSRHGQLTIISDALVNIDAQPLVPELMAYEGWSDLGQVVERIARNTVIEIRGPVVARGSVLGAVLGGWLVDSASWRRMSESRGRCCAAPGWQDWPAAIRASHHLLLSHGWAVPAIRANVKLEGLKREAYAPQQVMTAGRRPRFPGCWRTEQLARQTATSSIRHMLAG
jgi:hypothetical protein